MSEDEIILTLNKSSSPVKSLHLAEENIDWVAYLRQGEPEYVVGVEQPLSVSSDMSRGLCLWIYGLCYGFILESSSRLSYESSCF